MKKSIILIIGILTIVVVYFAISVPLRYFASSDGKMELKEIYARDDNGNIYDFQSNNKLFSVNMDTTKNGKIKITETSLDEMVQKEFEYKAPEPFEGSVCGFEQLMSKNYIAFCKGNILIANESGEYDLYNINRDIISMKLDDYGNIYTIEKEDNRVFYVERNSDAITGNEMEFLDTNIDLWSTNFVIGENYAYVTIDNDIYKFVNGAFDE